MESASVTVWLQAGSFDSGELFLSFLPDTYGQTLLICFACLLCKGAHSLNQMSHVIANRQTRSSTEEIAYETRLHTAFLFFRVICQTLSKKENTKCPARNSVMEDQGKNLHHFPYFCVRFSSHWRVVTVGCLSERMMAVDMPSWHKTFRQSFGDKLLRAQ